MPRVSVIVTTYNRPNALAAVLQGFKAQDEADFEIIIANDGSTKHTERLIRDVAGRLQCPVSHVWQEDRGFRAAAIRNRAVAQARGEYLIFIDGDCIPTFSFVRAHMRLAEPGWFVAGNRVLMSKDFTQRVLEEPLPVHLWTFLHWVYCRTRGWINRIVPLIPLPDGNFRKRNARRREGAKTCNLAVWRADLLRINGLDERYEGWGHEDADLVVRLIRSGVFRKDGRFATAVLHLWHPESDRSQLSANERRLATILAGENIRAVHGVDQYLS